MRIVSVFLAIVLTSARPSSDGDSGNALPLGKGGLQDFFTYMKDINARSRGIRREAKSELKDFHNLADDVHETDREVMNEENLEKLQRKQLLARSRQEGLLPPPVGRSSFLQTDGPPLSRFTELHAVARPPREEDHRPSTNYGAPTEEILAERERQLLRSIKISAREVKDWGAQGAGARKEIAAYLKHQAAKHQKGARQHLDSEPPSPPAQSAKKADSGKEAKPQSFVEIPDVMDDLSSLRAQMRAQTDEFTSEGRQDALAQDLALKKISSMLPSSFSQTSPSDDLGKAQLDKDLADFSTTTADLGKEENKLKTDAEDFAKSMSTAADLPAPISIAPTVDPNVP